MLAVKDLYSEVPYIKRKSKFQSLDKGTVKICQLGLVMTMWIICDLIVLGLLQSTNPLLIDKTITTSCSEDGTCSGQGSCNEATGTCTCNAGFEGNACEGKSQNPFKF